jgi:TolB-like protein
MAAVDVDRVIQRALAKAPNERFQTADAMARELRACLSRADVGAAVVAHAAIRLMVLPFRILRPDPAIDFLAFSLPDAITVSLSGVESLVVRSSLTAAKFATGDTDLGKVASEANVDAVVAGSLLHAGGQVRVNVQLVDALSGTVRWSHGLQAPLDDLFRIQDSICQALVEALALSLSGREQKQLRHDVPADAGAYAHYLQANQLSASSSSWQLAKDLYQRAVEADPAYAPAWARLARCLRVIGKYGLDPDARRHYGEAEEAFQRAFHLNPDLPLAHNLYTYAEVESGRAMQAVVRLLSRLKGGSSNPELYAGLVHACRYAGLLDASLAAYERARRLDPSMRTSVAHSYFMDGQYNRAIETDVEQPPYVTVLALLSLGKHDEAIAICQSARARMPWNDHLGLVLDALGAIVSRDYETGRAAVSKLLEFAAFSDPEGWYYWGQAAAGLEDRERAFDLLSRAVDTGLHCVRGLETTPLLDSLRMDPRFSAIVGRARAGHAIAARAFADADGHRLLGLPLV